MALRDPRNRSRNNASRRTTSATRSKRSATSAKYNPKPSSSQSRSSKKGTGSNRVTTGKGGKVTSPRLRQALETVKPKRTPAKTPPRVPKATQAGNQRVILEAFNRTFGSKDKPSKPVKTNPTSSTPRGAQGPRTAPQQGPSQRVSGLQGSRTKPTTTKAPPRTATPRVSNVGPQTRQARAVQQANPGRAVRAARHANTARVIATASNPLTIAGAIIGSDIANRSVADGTLKGKPNVPTKPGNHKATTKPTTKPTPKPTPKKPVDRNPIKAPPKKDSTVLAKKGGKEGVLRNGVFYATGWSPAQRNRYQIQQSKNKK